jgi:F-type H+-transporting ATPase subunit b
MALGITAHTAVPQPGAGFPPFQRDTFASQLTWLALSFVLLYIIVARIGLPRVASILTARRRHIETLLAEADTCKAKSQHCVGEYQRARGNIRQQAEALLQDTQRWVVAEAKQTRDALEVELDVQVAGAERSISAAKQDALANLRSIAIETSELVVASISGAVPAEGAAARAVDRVLKPGGEHAR